MMKGSNMQQGEKGVPTPSAQFRLRAWREFQKALDPLAPPKALPPNPWAGRSVRPDALSPRQRFRPTT
jgi:hypothetical protein